MPRQVRMYGLSAMMMSRLMPARMDVHEGRADCRSLNGRREPDGNQLAEHKALLGCRHAKSRCGRYPRSGLSYTRQAY
jgi:hypothetical protein